MTPERFMVEIRYLGEPHIPEGSTPEFIMDCYLDELKRYDEKVLESAAKRLIKARKHRNFPMPEECTRICDAVHEEFARKAEREGTGPAIRRTSKEDPAWSIPRIQAANRMMNSDIGRVAAAEGWILLLHDYCRANGHLPDGLAAEKVRRECLAILREQENNAKRWGTNNPIVSRIAHAFEIKRKKLSALAYGKEG